jgi:opacity protein-like surface antigen
MEINKLNVALFTTLTLAATTAAAADTYLTMGATTLKYKQQVSGLKLTSDSYALGLTLGANLAQNFAIEGLVATGLNSGDLKLDYALGIYAVVRSNENQTGSAYLKAGFTKMQGSGKLSYNGSSTTLKTDDSSFSYGIGVDFKASPNSSVRFEYMNYYDQDNVTIDGFGIGYKMALPY